MSAYYAHAAHLSRISRQGALAYRQTLAKTARQNITHVEPHPRGGNVARRAVRHNIPIPHARGTSSNVPFPPIHFTNSRSGFEPHSINFFFPFFCTLFAQPNGNSTSIDTPPHASHTREHDDIFSPYIVRPSHTGAISLPRGDFWQDQDPWGFKTRLRNMAGTSTLAYFFYRLNPLTHPCSHNLYLGLRPICCAIRMFLSLCTHSTRLFHDTRAIGP